MVSVCLSVTRRICIKTAEQIERVVDVEATLSRLILHCVASEHWRSATGARGERENRLQRFWVS